MTFDAEPLTKTLEATLMQEGSTVGEKADIDMVCGLFLVMYGSIAGLWILFKRLPETSHYVKHGKIGLLCITWASTSVGMHVLNKSLASTLQAPAMISMAQMVVSVVAMSATSFRKLFEVERRQLLTWMIVPCFFAGMLCSSFYTYEFISLSMLTVVRNLTPLIALPIESMVMAEDKKPKITVPIVAALLTMLAGALVYSNGVGNISQLGLMFAALNMVLALSDRVIQRRLLTAECKEMSSDVCTLVTNTAGLVPTLCLALLTHEIAESSEHQADWTNPSMVFLLLLSGVVGLGIAYFGFECQRAISATAFFVLQNASKIVVVSFGVVLFGDPVTQTTLMGMALSIGGSFMYGYLQMQKSPEQASEEEPLNKSMTKASTEGMKA